MKETSLAAYDALLGRLHILEEKVYKDSLTGVYNRRIYDELLFLPEENDPPMQTITFIIADIEKFKLLNDTYGHIAGDHCLKEAARVFSSHIDKYDFVIRYGGDEFLLILKNRNETQITHLIDLLKHDISQITIEDCPTLELRINMGFALSLVKSEEPSFFSALVRKADARMYQEKRGVTF